MWGYLGTKYSSSCTIYGWILPKTHSQQTHAARPVKLAKLQQISGFHQSTAMKWQWLLFFTYHNKVSKHSCFHDNKPLHPYAPQPPLFLFTIKQLIMSTKHTKKALRCILLLSAAVLLRITEVKPGSSNHTELFVELALAHIFQRKQTNTETEIWLLHWLSSNAH